MKNSGRLACLDALRGFDMFWIIGGDSLVHLLANLTGWGAFVVLSAQMRHVEWAGLHVYDLVFPLFMFLSGVSLALSIKKHDFNRGHDRQRFVAKAARRMMVLIVLGVIYNFGWDVSPDRFRVASVLGQIGVAYFVTAVLFAYLQSSLGRSLALVAILVSTAMLQLFVPVPGGVAGMLTPDASMNAWIDQTFLPGRLYGVSYDPEGLLNCFSASAVTMLGACFGVLVNPSTPGKSMLRIALAGVALVVTGCVLSIWYPIIKAAWTVPFSLITGGISALLLALFFWLFDVCRVMASGRVFAVIGINSIGIYLAARFLAYPLLALAADQSTSSPAASITIVLGVMAAEWLALYYCFRRGWFLKV